MPLAADDRPRPGYLERVRAAAERLGVPYELLVATASSQRESIASDLPPGVLVVDAGSDRFAAVLASGLRRASSRVDHDARSRSRRARSGGGVVVERATRGRHRHRIAVRRGRRGPCACAAAHPQPRVEPRLQPRTEPARARHVERAAALSRRRHREEHARDGFDLLQEILVRAYAEGWRVREVPFVYEPRRLDAAPTGDSGASGSTTRGRSGRCGSCATRFSRPTTTIARTTASSRCSATGSAALQARHRAHRPDQGAVLDVGCGLEPDHRRAAARAASASTCCDASCATRVSSARRWCTPQASSCRSRTRSFPCVLCSQVIEHVPKESPILDELCRALAPGGRLVLGTPDYARRRMGGDREAVRLLRAGRLRRRAHRALHARRADRPLHARWDGRTKPPATSFAAS